MAVLRRARAMINVEETPDFSTGQAEKCENTTRAGLDIVDGERVVHIWWALPRIRGAEIGDLGTRWQPGQDIPPGTWRLMLDMQVLTGGT